MISGFQTGKNKKIQLVENDKYNKIIIQFEDLSEEEEIIKSDNKPTKNDLNLLNSLSKEAIKINNQLYHPSKFAEQEFKFMSKNPRDSLSEKKISFQTVIMADEIQKEIITPIKKKEYNNNNEIFQMNTILLSKISKLPKCLIGEKFYEISKQFMKNSLLKFSSFCRLSTIPQNFDWKLIKEYFKQYDVEKDWLYEQAKLVFWKLQSKNNYTDQKLILELEYRYFIQYRLQSRTIIQEIWTNDQSLNQHMILLVVAIEQCQGKKILELSDGWYSIFFICEQSYDQIYNKIKIGQKLHVTNLKEYPIIFNTSNVKIITQYPFNKMLVTTKINSIKKAQINSKLGKQQQKYFVRSLKSLRNGPIPCIDVFIVSKSYLIKVNQKNQRKAILFNSETENEEEMQQLRNSNLCFWITVMDTLNYFDERKQKITEFKDILVHINDPLQYEMISVGQRVQIINAIQFNSDISIKLTKSSGILFELQQYQDYFNKLQIIGNKHEIQIKVNNHIKLEQIDVIEGSNDQYQNVKIEIQNSFFGEILKDQQMKILKVTQLNKINNERFQTTQMSKLINIINYNK
ncbi:unnamed protein product [Paramecium pentaurelia]|uniref:BRCA2 OB1 domain-containing protein n=1 Tax=Paramecium pentaurelia TaxID=43138 RepID=A0A8S1TMA2_9CILI|nr:unnamed protein product [Paramecium pentaurelia]